MVSSEEQVWSPEILNMNKDTITHFLFHNPAASKTLIKHRLESNQSFINKVTVVASLMKGIFAQN